jgi:hypothetical protein
MRKKLNILIATATSLIISGCIGSMPDYQTSKGTMIVFKTPVMRYADQGFVSIASSETKVEIYGNGQALMRLRITPNQVCVSKMSCMSKKEFNAKVLGNPNYPETLIENIFKGEPIFGMEGMEQSDHSFKQHIIKPGMNISYLRTPKRIVFNDTITGTKIKVVTTR